MSSETFHWSCKNTWSRSAKNTSWCLLGCSIGDVVKHLINKIEEENKNLKDYINSY